MAEMYQILRPDGIIHDEFLLQNIGLTGEDWMKIYKGMVLARLAHLEGERNAYLNKMTLLIGPMGQEAAEVASAYALQPENRVFVYGRSWAADTGKGVKIKTIIDIYLGYSRVKIDLKKYASRVRPNDVPVIEGDSSKFRRQTGWAPQVSFNQTLLDLLNDWRGKVGALKNNK